ncbi:MAG: valine--tRNA ligase [Clostridiales bacterium]|jgi:valyl-tRNA synthetase|nr:valine--tRNA ligase [Clostridiales bacterium]
MDHQGKQLDKAYSPASVEKRIYQRWLDGGYFHAAVDKSKKPYTIVIPPPNITGSLHVGHAVDNTLQDILIRWKRMQGYSALWMPGTDHASIATEAKIVEALKSEGTSKEEIGREKFLERAWAWRDLYGGRILEQLRRLGCSCDWERERFTMDEGLSRAVAEVFVRLHGDGLIYRGERIINWCPKCRTSISDIEVEYRERDGFFWHIKYPIAGSGGAGGNGGGAGDCSEFITVATTRPETMLGDTAVAVNPGDPRYAGYIGKMAVLPLMGREIPIIADEYVDSEFGTGAVKITPAHDPNDFEVGLRHGLRQIRVMDDGAAMNENAGAYSGLDRYEARRRIVADLDAAGLLEKTEPHAHNVGECSRCHETIEPIISTQWFMKMEPLAGPAIDAVRQGRTRFVPDRFSKTYFHWMENIQDWCISRQLWWGHRIPAYYCGACGEIAVAAQNPGKCPKCGHAGLRQDEDTLDTWFSSALWPFSTMGWPERTAELEYFYPTDVLVTGYDIIFFWVARMIFSAMRHTGDVPFRHVYMHGLVRDAQGRKMSKSLGNGVDPLGVIERCGADALRFALTIGNAPGNDLRLSDEKIESARNFTNKLWNAARFVLMNLGAPEPGTGDGADGAGAGGDGAAAGDLAATGGAAWTAAVAAGAGNSADAGDGAAAGDYAGAGAAVAGAAVPAGAGTAAGAAATAALQPTMADRWIMSGYNRLVKEATEHLDKFELGMALQKIYDFIWDEFCDWYIELAKPRLFGEGGGGRREALRALGAVLDGCVRLLHPFMPFITEEIYTALRECRQAGGSGGAGSGLGAGTVAGAGGAASADAGAGADAGAASVMVAEWPKYDASLEAEADTGRMRFLMAAIKSIRNRRSEMNVPPGKKASAVFVADSAEQAGALAEGRAYVERLASVSSFTVLPERPREAAEGAVALVVEGAEIFIPFGELVDAQKEIERAEKELAKLDKEIARAAGRLASEGFTSKAPEHVVGEERAKLAGYEEMRAKVADNLGRLRELGGR